MKERIEQFLSTADSPDTRDIEELKELYNLIGGKLLRCTADVCIIKMLTAIRKYYTLTFCEDLPEAKSRKYTLTPGLHSFAPGGPAVHHNDNTTDAEIEYYLSAYPHLKNIIVK